MDPKVAQRQFSELINLPEVPAQLPGIDIEHGVQRMAGKRDLFGKILFVFNQDNLKTVEQLRQALTGNDFDTLMCLVHRLKGAAGSIGAQQLYQQARTIDLELKGGNKDIAALLTEACSSLQEVLAGLDDFFDAYE